MAGTFEVEGFELDGQTGRLVIGRMTADEWARFMPQLERMRTIQDRRAPSVADPGAADTVEAIEATVARRAALAAAVEAENRATLAFAEWAVTTFVRDFAGRTGAELWADHYTHGGVWASLLFRIYEEHILTATQKKTLQSRSDSRRISGEPVNAISGEVPASVAAPVGQPDSSASADVTA